ncbi:MAG: DUF433 domain-containing protein [Planctomycetes bacterium]|nr:DUF433 domain-containing protein [Planctomycetota bacterium]
MKKEATANLLGVGIYSIPEASRLTGVTRGRIGRWLGGYGFASKSGRRYSPPVWKGEIPPVQGSAALGFLDLQEVRYIDAFRKLGVPWRTLRDVEDAARERLEVTHPFCTIQFKTDGREIFLEVQGKIYSFLSSQRYFERIIAPFLRGVDFQGQFPRRWWPMGHGHAVVLDPTRSFGKPIVEKEGIPTSILAKAVQVEGSIDRVAMWYEIDRAAVRDAVEFERSLTARSLAA